MTKTKIDRSVKG